MQVCEIVSWGQEFKVLRKTGILQNSAQLWRIFAWASQSAHVPPAPQKPPADQKYSKERPSYIHRRGPCLICTLIFVSFRLTFFTYFCQMTKLLFKRVASSTTLTLSFERSFCKETIFQDFHDFHTTGPQQLLQIASTWSMQRRATHAMNACNKQTNTTIKQTMQSTLPENVT